MGEPDPLADLLRNDPLMHRPNVDKCPGCDGLAARLRAAGVTLDARRDGPHVDPERSIKQHDYSPGGNFELRMMETGYAEAAGLPFPPHIVYRDRDDRDRPRTTFIADVHENAVTHAKALIARASSDGLRERIVALIHRADRYEEETLRIEDVQAALPHSTGGWAARSTRTRRTMVTDPANSMIAVAGYTPKESQEFLKRLLPEGTRIRSTTCPELTGIIKHYEWNDHGILSPIPYCIEWDDSARACEKLGWFFVYAGIDGIERYV